MGQEKLGKALGVTFQQVQKYEKGTNRVRASRVQRMAAVLGVPAAYELRRFIAANEGRDLNPYRLPRLAKEDREPCQSRH
ncbi:helix-turn-helix domain-containing protein [Shinella sp.]|uniref:helix-turn-helix domain-containing protein n=1 Tax=Shinella sp. TaxID=1870904 RepID=UPI0039E6425B